MTTEPTAPATPVAPTAEPKLNATQVRYLTPDMCRIHLGNLSTLHVTVINEAIYGGVYAACAFPVAHPSRYISLIHSTGKKDVEIGIIRDLNEFPPEAVKLVRDALRRRYFVHTITKINRIEERYNNTLLAFDVETDKGPINFFMRWALDRAVDYGRTGKVLIDLDNNRYLIPDVEKLSTAERNAFTHYIYW